MAVDDHTEVTQEMRYSPPLMTWEEEEAGKTGEVNLPGCTEMPTMAERAFMRLARDWRSSVSAEQDRTQEQGWHEDTLVLACLLLVVRWGRGFTSLPKNEIMINRHTHRRDYGGDWLDDLAWDLCEYALLNDYDRQIQHRTIEALVANLSHDKSSIRVWIVNLAWLFFSEIPAIYNRAAVNELLKNVATAIIYWNNSAALASRFFVSPGDFLDYAYQARPSKGWDDQYTDRLNSLKGELTTGHELFSHLEKTCWDVIVPAFMDKKFVPLSRDSIFCLNS